MTRFILPISAPRAFTLIELLIVVAIIAILAAIAVPNFIDAQTRSKVSRVVSDLRALRTATESYAVDNSRYPRMTWGCSYGDWWNWGTGVCEEPYGTFSGGPARDCAGVASPIGLGGGITTPISYVSSLTFDPFSEGQQTRIWLKLYTYFYSDDFRRLGGGVCTGGFWKPTPGQMNIFEYWNGKYVLWSVGPQGQIGHDLRPPFVQYDPTNGTLSSGSIFVSHKFTQPTWVNPTML